MFYWEGNDNLEYYETQFEAEFLRDTRAVYISKAQRWFGGLNVQQYLFNANKAFEKEDTNADTWLQISTKPKMYEIIKEELVTKMAEQICDKEGSVTDFF